MEYRSLKAVEYERVRDFFENYYGPGVYCTEQSYFDWLHFHHPQRSEWVEPDEVTVLAAVDDQGIQACICYVPGEVYVDGHRRSAVFTTESLATEECRGAFGLLARRLVSRFDYAFIMGATEFLRDLYVRQLAATYGHEMQRLLLIGDVDMLQRLRRLKTSSIVDGTDTLEGWAAETRNLALGHPWSRIDQVSDLQDAYWRDMLSSGISCCRRDPAWLQWRYAEHPHVRYEMIAAESSQDSGIAVVRREAIRDFEGHAVRLLEFLPTANGSDALAGAVAKYTVDSGAAFLDFFCAERSWSARLPSAFIRSENHLALDIPYLLQPPEWRPRRSINLLAVRNRRRRRELPLLEDGDIYLTKGDGAQDIALNRGYHSAHLRQTAVTT